MSGLDTAYKEKPLSRRCAMREEGIMFEGELWLICAMVVGACVGSFLNVVIYRVPRGLSVNEPKRSFCPGCKAPIPWWRNIPVLTWVLQRGRCAGCQGAIPVRYAVVEVLTAGLFTALWCLFPGQGEVLLGWVFLSLLISISFIDGEHYVIPVTWCWVGVVLAVLGGVKAWGLVNFNGLMWVPSGWAFPSVWFSVVGAVVGYVSLLAVVLLGKLAFGKKKMSLAVPTRWFLKEPKSEEEQLQLVIGSDATDWGEVFYRKSDRIELSGSDFLLDGKELKGSEMTIRELEVEVEGRIYPIEEMQSLEGKVQDVVIPREAMGGGDPPLLAMIGAFLGAPAVFFTIFASSFFALIAAFLGRVGFGKPLPFGPFLALGALTWLFGGYRLFSWYLNLLGV